MRTKLKQLLQKDPLQMIGKSIVLCGWIRTVRDQKSFLFIEMNDGSTVSNFQVIADETLEAFEKIKPLLTTGTSVKIHGNLVKSLGQNQALELKAETIEVLGVCDPTSYPLQKKRHSFEFLRTIAHLRPRTNTQGAVLRVRSALAFATHLFFQEKGFQYVHTPILTSSDCEGGGEMFQLCPIKDEKGHLNEFFGKPAYLTAVSYTHLTLPTKA